MIQIKRIEMQQIDEPFGTYALSSQQNRLLRLSQVMPVNWFGRRGALVLRRAVLSNRPLCIDATVEGLKLRLYMRDNVSERKFLFMPQFFDTQERALMRQRLRPGGVFVDVGANAGLYALTAALAVGETGRVLAIEPNPIVLNRLRFNSALNGFDGRLITEEVGVSDEAGSFDLMLDRSNLGGSSLVLARSGDAIRIPCLPLLDIVQRHGLARIDGLKIDIEGAEDKALIPFFRDAPSALHPGFLILENSSGNWAQDLLSALHAAGYTHSGTTRMNLIWQKEE
ncbi:MAG TPA: FkbM family methyltransferase [Azospirillum sp.]|nr:FkbM family methyltransferase [Azospirillum sp.]